MTFDSRTGTSNREAYVGFTLPEDLVVADIAKVEFQFTFQSRGTEIIGADIGYTATGWDELTLTWTNSRAAHESGGFPSLGTIASLSDSDIAVGNFTVDVTNYVVGALESAQTAVSFVFIGTSGNFVSIMTKERSLLEGQLHPTLVITAVPEPSTYAAIFGLLALGFLVVRRRMTA